jgi:Uma2 family endonuclease
MGMPVVEHRRWTAAEVRALPEEPGKQFEVIDGELLVSPGPSLLHQRLGFVLMQLLETHVRTPRVAYVLDGPGEVEPDPYTLVQPDIFVVAPVNGKCPPTTDAIGDIYLVCEVISPGSARTDRVRKRVLYQRMGVEYWIVDPHARVVERWLPGDDRPTMHDTAISWSDARLAGPLTVDLVELFAEALDR